MKYLFALLLLTGCQTDKRVCLTKNDWYPHAIWADCYSGKFYGFAEQEDFPMVDPHYNDPIEVTVIPKDVPAPDHSITYCHDMGQYFPCRFPGVISGAQ